MIDVLKQQLRPGMSKEEKYNLLRDFLQLTALKIMYDHGYFKMVAFVGGTALRFIYNLRRYSEDLDFSLIHAKGYDFNRLNDKLITEFKLYGLEAETSPKTDRTVHGTFLKFPKVLKQLDLSPMAGQKISIKLEIDSNPPSGWNMASTYINRMYTMTLAHYDVESLYGSKLHAIFFRTYIKGRDFYDLLWYLGKKIKPNLLILNNAAKQAQGVDMEINENNFNQLLLERLRKVDFADVKKDVQKFLEDPKELAFMDLKTFESLLH